jgi:hypothetical protein
MDGEQDPAVINESDSTVVVVAGNPQDQHVTAPVPPRSSRSGCDAAGGPTRRAPEARKSGQAESDVTTRDRSGERVCDNRILGVSGDLDPPNFLQIPRKEQPPSGDGESTERADK